MNNLQAVPSKRELMEAYIKKQTGLYFHTMKTVKERSETENIELSTEDLRTITTTIFINTQRKFNL
jgi:hypothetical protein